MSINTQACVVGLVALLYAGPLMAADVNSTDAKTTGKESSSVNHPDELKDAKETVREAAKMVQKLEANPETRDALSRARAVFLVPDYARASLGVGGAGGEGVVVAKNDGGWTAPAFYNVGAINLGLEGGVEAGQVAFLIMTDVGRKQFLDENNFSLNADAGLTIINWAARGQASAGKGPDVIAWTDTEGLYGDLAVSVSDIFWDDEANRAYYGQKVAAREILNGSTKDAMSQSPLRAEFNALKTQSRR